MKTFVLATSTLMFTTSMGVRLELASALGDDDNTCANIGYQVVDGKETLHYCNDACVNAGGFMEDTPDGGRWCTPATTQEDCNEGHWVEDIYGLGWGMCDQTCLPSGGYYENGECKHKLGACKSEDPSHGTCDTYCAVNSGKIVNYTCTWTNIELP